MSLASTLSIWRYDGNGLATSFAFTTKILQAADLRVYHRDADGVETLLTNGVDYSATGFNVDGGGSVTYPLVGGPLPTGEGLTLQRYVTPTQPTDLQSQGAFTARTHEDVFDRLTMILQQHEEQLSRTAMLAVTEDPIDVTLPSPQADYFLAWNSSGNGLASKQFVTTGTLVVSSFVETLLDDGNSNDFLTTLGFSTLAKNLRDDTTLSAYLTTMGISSDVRPIISAGTLTDFLNQMTMSAFVQGLIGLGSATTFRAGIGLPVIPRQIGGLELTQNGADPDRDIDFASGVASAASGLVYLHASSGMTKRLDAVWASGTNAGGRASATSLSSSTWYHCFVVNDVSGNVDFGFDTSATATNLLADTGGTNYQLIGSILTDGSSNIVDFVQRGNWFYWNTPKLDVSVSSAPVTGSRTLYALSTPPDVRTLVQVRTVMLRNGTSLVLLTNPDEADADPSLTAAPLVNVSNAVNNTGVYIDDELFLRTNTAKQIAARAVTSAPTNFYLATVAYEHPRGRW